MILCIHMWNFELAKRKMKEHGRTTDWLARECGIEVTSLRNALQGRKPSLSVIKLMALKLETSEEELLLQEPETAS